MRDLKTSLTRLRLRAESLPDAGQRDGAVADIETMMALIDDAISFARRAAVSDRLERVDIVALLRSDIEARADERLSLVAGGEPIE